MEAVQFVAFITPGIVGVAGNPYRSHVIPLLSLEKKIPERGGFSHDVCDRLHLYYTPPPLFFPFLTHLTPSPRSATPVYMSPCTHERMPSWNFVSFFFPPDMHICLCVCVCVSFPSNLCQMLPHTANPSIILWETSDSATRWALMTARHILNHPPNQSADLLQLDNRRREGRRRDAGVGRVGRVGKAAGERCIMRKRDGAAARKGTRRTGEREKTGRR